MTRPSPLAAPLALAAALAITVGAAAQRLPDPLQFVPAECDLVVRMRGPAAWKREFAGTGLGQALASEALRPKWDQLFDSLAASADIAEERREHFAALPSVLREYGGELVVAVRLDWERMTFGAGAPAGAVLVAFAPDRESEAALPRVHAVLDKLLARDPVREADDLAGEAPADQIELGGISVPLRSAGAGQLAGPALINDCLVVVLGSDLRRSAAPFFAVPDGGRPPIAPQLRGATLGLQVAIARCIDGLCAVDEPGGEAQWMAMIRDLGFGSIDRLTLTMFPDGRYVGQTFGIEHTAGAEGLMRLLLPSGRQKPQLLRYLPEGARTFSVAPFDGRGVEEFYPRLLEIGSTIAPMPLDRAAIEQQFTDFTRLRLVEDVLQLIGDEYMMLPDSAAPIALVEESAEAQEAALRVQQEFGNSCFLLHVRDGEAWLQNLDTAIRARGLHVGRKQEEHAGTTIYSLTLLGMLPLEYAVIGDVFVVGLGASDATRHNLRAVLDRGAAIASAGDAAAAVDALLSAPVRERLERLPRRWHGLEVAAITEVIDGMTTSIGALGDMVQNDGDPAGGAGGPPAGEVLEAPWRALYELLAALRPELARHAATTVVSATYYAQSRYLCRSRW